MIGKILQKIERAFALPGIIREYGVISSFRHGRYQCEVQAFLRKLGDQIVLTLRHKNTHPGNTNIQYLDLSADGIQSLRDLIDQLEREGTANQTNGH